MARRIALFRGINVGGNNILPMRELVTQLSSLALQNVRTYIQSGNAVFDTGPKFRDTAKNRAKLESDIAQRIEREFGFRPKVLILAAEELQEAIDSNPFPDAIADPKSLHVFFFETAPADPDLGALNSARSATEAYVLDGQRFYLHAPDGAGRSKLAATAEKHLGVAATSRNYRTVETLAMMSTEK